MLEFDDRIEFSIESKDWYLSMRNDRIGRRLRSEGETAMRWARRWHERSRDTVTGPLYLESADVGDDFMRNLRTLWIRVPRIVNGQDHGLPPHFEVNANVLAMPKKPGPAVAVRADDPNSPPY